MSLAAHRNPHVLYHQHNGHSDPGAIISVPGIQGMRYMSFLGLFLFKDVIALGASFYLIGYFGHKAVGHHNKA